MERQRRVQVAAVAHSRHCVTCTRIGFDVT
eukprot:COSAG05_NODE_24753_length_221_cov_1.327869_1_plen_29_part_01